MKIEYLPKERILFLYDLAKRSTELYTRDSIEKFYDELDPEEFMLIVEELLDLEIFFDVREDTV